MAQGIYRPHLQQDLTKFTSLAVDMFPDFAGRITCFGSDWLGRQFAEDSARIVDGAAQVLMLDAGAAQVLEVPTSRVGFHQQELVEYSDAAVASGFFKTWRLAGGAAPAYGQCLGYKQPLFLGGRDEVANLEVTDFEVYWDLLGQMWRQLRKSSEGS